MDVEDGLHSAEGDPCPRHQRHPVELLVGVVLLGLGEPRIIEREVVERELLRELDGDALPGRVPGPGRPLGDVLVGRLVEVVLRSLRNAGLQSNDAGVDLGDAFAHELARSDRDEF